MAELKRISGELGEIFIADKVIESIVVGVLATIQQLKTPKQVEEDRGIIGVLSPFLKGSGVEIINNNERLVIKLALLAEYGVRINEVAAKTIKLVREKIQELASLEVDEIEIEIKDVFRRSALEGLLKHP